MRKASGGATTEKLLLVILPGRGRVEVELNAPVREEADAIIGDGDLRTP
jgi:hypothetical protein